MQTDNFDSVLLCPICGERFGDDVIECPTDNVPLVASSGNALLPGSTFGDRFEIVDLLGEGGMGAVYKARQRFTGQIVAIKMLHATGDQQSYRRFKQEGRAAAAVDHPNVAKVLDFGISDTGQPYLVLEYVEGISLSTLLEQHQRLEQKRCLPLMIQVCAALEAAHSKNIIHRDLKPSNIMITGAGTASEQVKLVDFGIAKMLDPERKQGANLTVTGEVFGSPSYMSPEQCTGQPLDARSDIYSVGCVMYESLTGVTAFGGSNNVETMWKQLNEQPSMFKVASPTAKISRHLETITFKCLAKESAQRYASMRHLQEDLQRVLNDQTPLNLGKFVTTGVIKKPKVIQQFITVAAMTVGGFLIFVGIVAFTFAAGSTFVLTHYLAPADVADAQNQYAEAERLYTAGVQEAAKIPFGEGCLGNALDRLGIFYQRHAKYEQAQQIFERALKLRADNFWTGKLELCEELNNLAYQYLMQKKFTEAEPLFMKAISLYEGIKHNPHPNKYASLLRNYASLLEQTNRKSDLEKVLKRAKEVDSWRPYESSSLDWFLFQK
jgi:eukaryotic-like serine/threonine-protein kinase